MLAQPCLISAYADHPVDGLYQSFCNILQTPAFSRRTVSVVLILCVIYLGRAIWHSKKRAFWLGDRLLGMLSLVASTERAHPLSRVSSGDQMNLVLLKLMEYLGHTNALLCGLAYDEVSCHLVSGYNPLLMNLRSRDSQIIHRSQQ
jgi:hypothetical protein